MGEGFHLILSEKEKEICNSLCVQVLISEYISSVIKKVFHYLYKILKKGIYVDILTWLFAVKSSGIQNTQVQGRCPCSESR